MRVVICDDSVLLREGLARLLEDAGFDVVGQAGNADDGHEVPVLPPIRIDVPQEEDRLALGVGDRGEVGLQMAAQGRALLRPHPPAGLAAGEREAEHLDALETRRAVGVDPGAREVDPAFPARQIPNRIQDCCSWLRYGEIPPRLPNSAGHAPDSCAGLHPWR